MSIDKKVALVTGGTGGIGEAVIRRFLKDGNNIAFTYHSNDAKANQLVQELQSAFKECKIQGYKLNIGDAFEVKKVVEEIIQDYLHIDILVNNAGVTNDNLLMLMSDEQWNQVINTNLNGCFHMISAVLPSMIEKHNGNIVNISSVSGIVGIKGQTNYAASKAGICALTKSLAKEVAAKNIRVNAIAPGYVATEMIAKLSEKTLKQYKAEIPMRRFGKVEEIASLVSFISSEEASYITGQTMIIDGGLTS